MRKSWPLISRKSCKLSILSQNCNLGPNLNTRSIKCLSIVCFIRRRSKEWPILAILQWVSTCCCIWLRCIRNGDKWRGIFSNSWVHCATIARGGCGHVNSLLCASWLKIQMYFSSRFSRVLIPLAIFMNKSISCRLSMLHRHTRTSGSSRKKVSLMWVSRLRIASLRKWSRTFQPLSCKNGISKSQCFWRKWKRTPRINSKSITLTLTVYSPCT